MQFTVQGEDIGKRMDVFVTEKVSRVSRAFITKLVEQGKILANSSKVKGGHKLKLGDNITVDYDFGDLDQAPDDINMPILYEDDACLVINKPVGVLTHSKGAYNPEATVATFIASRVEHMSGDRAGIVHRLDRATSGVIICAKNSEALSWLQKQFSQRKTKKTYYAVVAGQPSPTEAIIDMPIERNPKDPKTFRTGSNGKPALTHYQVIESNSTYSLLKLQPTTGRTHQLRVHLKQLGHPIAGDVLYGGEPADRLYLHAEQLELTLPSRQRMTFTAPLPADFRTMLK
jgi:23S rRNA pseudouridine1911/1915/1917 synthase